jgi:hypothetical protein
MKRRIIAGFVSMALLLVTTPIAFAADYNVELVVPAGKKSKETDAVLKISDTSFSVTPEKDEFKDKAKTFNFADIKTADYSYSKKPMLSGGGAVATAILIGVFALPFLFMKKKNHWLSIQTEKEFAVLKLDKSNYMPIKAEFETHGVKVKEIQEEKDK